jgi:recombinational DNA repair protein (RecF pathway)
MYQKYHTEVLVLSVIAKGESDALVVLMTRDFGLVRARATGLRNESSKMRYALQPYSRSTASLIKGARGWRVAGASARAVATPGSGLAAFARASDLMQRLVQGEEKNERLFDVLDEAHRACMEHGAATPTIEIVTVARILYALGYLSLEALQIPEQIGTTLFGHNVFSSEAVQSAEAHKDTMLKTINRALSETHL